MSTIEYLMVEGGKREAVDVAVSGVCPFCEKNFSAGHLVSTGDPVVFHDKPPCARFVALDAMTYLAAANAAMGGVAGEN